MKLFATLLIFGLLLFAASVPASAGDFDWTGDFNQQARINPTGFRKSLAARFGLGSMETRKIIRTAGTPADAYIILRLAEMSGKAPVSVVTGYKNNQGGSWESLAGNLGIKPGSNELRSLREDHDLHGGANRARGISFSPDQAMLILLTGSICRLEAQNSSIW